MCLGETHSGGDAKMKSSVGRREQPRGAVVAGEDGGLNGMLNLTGEKVSLSEELGGALWKVPALSMFRIFRCYQEDVST